MSGDYVNVVAPAQPREWFAVLFGSRLLRGELRFVHKLTDAVKSICLDEGLPLTDRPSHRVIFEDVDVNVLVRDMRREVNRIQLKHYEGPHMPFVIVIDDQTLLELHEKYVEPNFSEDAWIYSLRGPRVKECVAVDAWDQIRLDIKDLKPLMDEYNPLPPLPVSRREPPLREKEFRPISNRHRDEGYSTRERQIDRYESEVRTRDYAPSPPITNGKAKITAVVVDGALINVEIHPSLIERLAEDMDANVDYANIKDIQQLPRTDTEVLSLLRLFVLSTENTLRNQNAAEREHGVQLRRKITETMLKSGLLKEVRDVFVGGLHDRLSRDDITDNDILKAASAIHLLFRAFIQLGNHDFVLHEDALSLWRQMETPVFTLPSRFWRVLSPDLIERLCDAAAEITTNNREVYIANVRVALEGLPSTDEHHAGPSTEGGDRRERIVDNGRPSVSPADRYDPYDWEDESDTSERYGTGEDGYDGRPRRDGRDGRDGHQENRRRQEEERRRREEEERIREAEELRELEEKAEREREFERIRHNQAMQQLEKKRWQEGNDLCIAWSDNDGEPPVSYRTLANRPAYSDLYRPKAPYMRRALMNGAYSDNEHYLDVQFRLMREDMVSPLRDGIYTQKIEAGPGKMIVSNNELKIYPTIEVGSLQVRSIDGLPMRVVNIPQHMLFQIRENRQLKFGQCVVLSSDKFEREFHIGWICDRFQEPGQPWQGKLAVSFFDECHPVKRRGKPIEKTETYALAESPAYLEAYRHVLRSMKKMKKNVAFPLERYLVHMKKNSRLPQYMRVKEKEEDKEEDKERQTMYMNKIAEDRMAQNKANEEKKTKEERRSRSRSDSDVDEEEGEHVTTEEGVSEENLVDDGFNTDEEDAFLTGGRTNHPNPRDLETISIRGTSYNVEKLEDEFQTDSLDETQRKAMCYALTSELAIIQGPPGTGKTHIGVEIVMAILENRIKWRMTEPILIVTFSNQALDHFLDKIRVKIEERGLANADAPSIVRLGSRSEHEAIKLNCLLATVMREYEEELACESASERNKAKKTKQAWLMKLMRAVKMVQISRKSIMEYNRLRQIMSPDHDQQLRQYAYGLRDSSGNQLCMDEVLVSWLLAKTYERKRDLPPGSDDDDEEEGRSRAGGANERVVEKKPIGRKKEEGRETKKEKNERKRREKRHQWNEGEDSSDSEEEDEVSWPAMVSSEANDEEEIENLVEMLEKMNESCKKNQASLASEEKWRKTAEKYEMEQDWEVEKEYSAKNGGRILVDDVEIFSRTTKPGSVNNGGGRGKEKAVNVDPNIVKDIHEQKQYILQKEGMTRDEVAAVRDVRNLPKEQRWKLLVYWQNTLANCMRSSLDDYCRQHEMACEKYEVASDASRAAVLKRALVIGATTTGAAKRRALLSRIGPKVLVVEEAAEVLEAHLLASIVPSVQHAIFIGDHQQLRPSTAVHQLAKMANMEVSLFERLVKNGYPFHTLGLQHRMLAPLTEHVVKPFFYKMLRDALSIHEYPSVQGMATNLFFWAHNVAEDTVQDSMSKRNKVEAEMCRNLANYIIMQGQYTPKEITIIGMYGAQVQEIKRKMQDLGPVMGDVAVETVDSFQGKENRVMILSLVRSKSGNIGFLGTPNRITVALTRAQHGMYVIGNFEDIASHSAMWDDITRSLNNAHYIDYALPVAISVNMHFSERTPFGGCDQQCGYQMPCGHPCKIICHPPHQHERFCAEAPNLECREACIKRCQKCDAQCTKRCQEPCGTCHSIVTLDLDCGHNVKCECGARNLARCKEPCGVVLECGHSCQNKCSVECVSVDRCEKGVGYDHPVCKHSLVLPCNRVRHATTVLPCYEKCPERLVCGHKCPLNCGEVCPSNCETMVTFMAPCGHQLQKKCSEDARHVKCTALVDSLMPHCSHKIKMECYQSRNQNECRSMCKKPTSCDHECTLTCGQCFKKASVHECNARCTKSLPCGHPCQGLCGRPCLCLANCRVRCSHQRCGSMSKEKGGNLSFGRQCSQPCVQCFEACDNHCEHRSCSKKCFEVCDVQACSQPCQKMLRCGHACLGLCGETCPKLCGTCDRTRYMSLIAGMASDDEPVPRLIQMPDCEHVYAYKWMDKSVKEQLTAGCVVLKCPRCSGMIEDCKRYMKQTKRLWAEADSRKWEKKMNDEEMSRAELKNKYNEMKNRLYLQQDEVAKYHKTVSRNAGREREKFALETFRMLESLYSVVRPELMKMTDSRAEYYYWETVVRCHQSVCGLVLDYLVKWEMLRVDFVNDNQPNLKAVMEEAFERRRSRVYPMRDQFTAMVEVVKSSLRDRRVGQLVPAIRSAMIMNHLYYHMEHLNATMRSQVDERGELQDLTLAQAGTYKRVIRSIRSEPLADHPEQKLVDMMNKIHADVYGKLQLGGHSCKVFKVDLPDF